MLAHLAHNPLVEVLGLGAGHGAVHGSINQAVHRCHLILLGQHGDVVLEGVGDPKALVAHVGDALVVEPVILLGQSLVETVVEVLVVGEDNVATNVVQLKYFARQLVAFCAIADLQQGLLRDCDWKLTKPSGVTSVAARPPAFSLESTINQEGPFYIIEGSTVSVCG